MAEPGGLESLAVAVGKRRGPAPVEQWNPPYCGELDIRITTDGTWLYLGSPIGRTALVRLFASVLKREGEHYYLVTPVEKIGIKVDDAPFLAIEFTEQGQGAGRELVFHTNVGDLVPCDAEHRLRFEPEMGTGGLKPYLHVRRGLWARATRSVFLDLVEIGETRVVDGERLFGVASAGIFFPMARESALQGS
jgi:hypothetical protein